MDSVREIRAQYLLLTTCNPFYVDNSGHRYIDPLWAKDLVLHTAYIERLTIAAPRIDASPPESFVAWDSLPVHKVQVVDLPALPSFWTTIKQLPFLVACVWKAIGAADVVHAGVAGWPIPDGWVSIPLARLRRRFVIVVVESDFWRINNETVPSLKRKIRARGSEVLNRWCVNRADVAFFTHSEYKRSLLPRHPQRGHVVPASWVDESAICSDAEATLRWEQKLGSGHELRLIFVGRLVPEKGVGVLLRALESLQSAPCEVSCDILGDGPLKSQVEAARNTLKSKIQIRLLGSVQYGPPLFSLLANYHALVAPNISNEQPRIVYDAYACALPVLGFHTDGLESCVADGVTGRLCAPNSVPDLAALVDWAANHREDLARMGIGSLSVVRSRTHEWMHRRRCEVLAPMIATHMRSGDARGTRSEE